MNAENILIIGAGPQALFLVRELCRLNHDVTLIGRNSEIAMHSKYAKKVFVETEENLISELKQLASEMPKQKCFVASGFYLAFLMNHFPAFTKLFNVFPRDVQSVRKLMIKTETYQLAHSVDILYPKSVLLSDKNIQFEELNYPQIVKWNRDICLFEKPRFKTTCVQNTMELRDLINKLSEKEKEALVSQDYLGSDLRNNFSYGAYVFDGEVKMDICVNEVRHFRSGVSSVVEEYTGSFATEIRNAAFALIYQTQFTGFLDVEFKIKGDKLYLLEVNPRPFGFIKIMKKKYPDLIPVVMGEKAESFKNKKPVKWINFLRDMVLILKNPASVFHMLQLVFDFENRTFDVWDINDPVPFFYQMKR